MPPGPTTPSSAEGTHVRVLSGRYRLDSVLGHGGVGVVWRARDLQLDRDVAVKQLQPGLARDPVASQRFHREATMAASLVHSSMVTIFDVGEDDGGPYLVMELVDGPPLAEVLRSHGAIGFDETIAMGHRVASALAVAHDRGLVHRDVKPGNVLLSRDGTPRLVDFGTVHVRGETSVELTTPGTMLGTIGYVAPEQLEGEVADARSDVFSLGLVLYECLVGAPAFATGPVAEMTRRRLTDEVPAPSTRRSGVPGDLDDLVWAATRRDPASRPDDAAAMADALAPFVHDDADRILAALASGAGPAPRTEVVESRPSPPPVVEGTEHTSVMPTAASAPDGGTSPPTTRTSPATETPAPPDEGTSSRRRATLLPLLGFAALVLGVVLAVVIVDPGSQGRQIDAQSTDGAGDGGVSVAEATDFDPLGDDGGEHGDEVGLVHDGDPATAWTTSRYQGADLGGLKDGVGLWVRAEDAAAHAEIDLSIPGVTAQVYAFDQPPSGDPSSWGEPVQTFEGAEGTVTTDLPEDSTVVLVWFTQLGEGQGGNQAGIGEIRLS